MLVLVESNGNDDDAFAPSSSSSKSDSSSSSIKTPLSLLANCSFTKISPSFELNPSCSQSARKNTSHRIAVGNVVSVEFVPATPTEVLLLSPNGIRKITSCSSLSSKTIPPIPILRVNTNSDVHIVSICKDFSHCLNRISANCLSMSSSSSSFNSRRYLSFPVGEILI